MAAPFTIDTRLHPLDALRAVRQLMRNPEDTRQIFNIFRALRGRSGVTAFNRFAATSNGQDLLRRRPSLLNALSDRSALRALPEGSVGRAYLAFMEAENLSAAGLVEASDNWDSEPVPADMNYFRGRTRDAHDVTHIVTGYGRDPLGELCLLAFMHAHTGNFGMVFVVMMSWTKLPQAARSAVKQAWRSGRKAVWFQDQPYEALLPQSLAHVRQALGIDSPSLYRELIGPGRHWDQ